MVGLGELLWDMLPGGRLPGGAPANFAFHAASLGHEGVVASRVGADALGDELAGVVSSLGLGLEALQRDPEAPTGTVQVEVGADGQPRYTIVEGVAWDRIEWTPALEAVARRADVVCFGTLARRAETSRETIRRFLAATRPDAMRVFDINLRGSFFDATTLAEGLRAATLAKMNDEEAPVVAGLLGLPFDGGSTADREAAFARALADRFEIGLVCITRGGRGSLLARGAERAEHPGFAVEVRDTVGAGDAFVAALAHHALAGSSLARAGEAANRLGAMVAGQAGATPRLPPGALAEIARTDAGTARA